MFLIPVNAVGATEMRNTPDGPTPTPDAGRRTGGAAKRAQRRVREDGWAEEQGWDSPHPSKRETGCWPFDLTGGARHQHPVILR